MFHCIVLYKATSQEVWLMDIKMIIELMDITIVIHDM